MAWNRLADAGYDAVNPRTREWALPQGQIEPAEVIVFALGNFLLLVYAAYRLEPICFYLAPAAVFFLVSYSYTKRFTSLCHFFPRRHPRAWTGRRVAGRHRAGGACAGNPMGGGDPLGWRVRHLLPGS